MFAVCNQCDRLAADMAVELKRHGVTAISLWPGAVKTELVSDLILERNVVESGKFKVHLALAAGPDPIEPFQNSEPLGLSFSQMRNVFMNAETTEVSGKCIVGLAKGRCTLNVM